MAELADYNILLIPAFAEILMAEDIPDRVRELRFDALRQLQGHLGFYQQRGYLPMLLSRIAEKKAEMILTATSKTEMDKLLKPRCPHYDGNRFVPDEYSVPEEELICWSETSFLGPLNEIGYSRYMEVFRQVFPEESEQIFSSAEAAYG